MHPLYSIPNFLTSALIISLGVFVVLKRPREKISWLFCLLTCSVAVWLVGYALVYCTTDAGQALRLSRFAYIGVVFIPTFFLHFMSEFLQVRRRGMLIAAYTISVLFLYVIRQDYFMNGVHLYFWGYYPTAGPLYWPWLIYFYAGFGICDYQFTRAYFVLRRSSEHSLRTKQLQLVLWANCVASISLMDYLPKYGVQIYPCAYLAALGWLALMAYAIVKFRLMEVQLVVRKTLIYSFVSALLTSIYFMLVTLFTHLSSGVIGKSSWISVAAAGVVVTMIFLPVFRRVQRLIDRLFFRFRIDREAKLMKFSSEIIQQENTEHLTQSLFRILEDSLHPKVLGFYLQTRGSGDFLEVSGRIPLSWDKVLAPSNPWVNHFRKDAEPVLLNSFENASAEVRDLIDDMERLGVHAALPLVSRTDILGFLLLGEKRSEESYTNDDLILLRIIANQATVAYERPRLLREVSSGFVHEIKMPLSKISLPAELTIMEIEKALKEKAISPELLPKIQRRMKYIIDQAFLASHRVDALQQLGSSEVQEREPVRLDKIILKSVDSLEESIKQARVTLHNQLPKDLPAVPGDSTQLEIVFVNLIKNAVEAMKDLPAGSSRDVRITGRSDETCVVVGVSDTGQGIKSGDQERIFQSHYTTKGAQGAGMGLFLARQIIQMHGGTITAASGASAGTDFVVILPLVSTPNSDSHP